MLQMQQLATFVNGVSAPVSMTVHMITKTCYDSQYATHHRPEGRSAQAQAKVSQMIS